MLYIQSVYEVTLTAFTFSRTLTYYKSTRQLFIFLRQRKKIEKRAEHRLRVFDNGLMSRIL